MQTHGYPGNIAVQMLMRAYYYILSVTSHFILLISFQSFCLVNLLTTDLIYMLNLPI